MTAGESSKILDLAMVATAGVLSGALIATVVLGLGPPWTPPLTCTSMAISVAEGAVGEPTPEAALQRWLDESASMVTPRFGWTSSRRDGFVFMSVGSHEVEISDLTQARGTGWMVTAATCA